MSGSKTVPTNLLGWALLVGGYVLAALTLLAYRRWNFKVAALLQEAERVVKETNAQITNPTRVKLSCPWCNWEETVIRVGVEAAVEAGNERIMLHNVESGHVVLSGRKPRSGYYKGDPIN